MKKLLVLLALCMVLAVMFVACNNEPEPPVEETTAGSTEAPTQGETEAPTTDEGTTQAPTTEETTQAPTTEETTQAPTTEESTEPPVVIDPVKVGMSFDQLYTGNGPATAGEENFFTPGQSGSWDGKAVIEDYNIEYVTVWGWVAFFAETPGTFGYQIGDADPVFDAAFSVEAEQPVIDAAHNAGGKSAARMHISIPVLYVSGEDIVIKALAKDAVGTVETLVEFTLTKPVNPNAPVFVLDAAALSNAATNGFNPNMISSAVLSANGSYFTITSTDGGDPYFYPMSPGDTVVDKGAQYVVIKYRTTYDGEGKGGEFFAGSGAGPTGGADEARFEYVADGKWNLVIVDLSTVSAVNEAFDLNYLRYDFYLGAKNTSIDIGYIAAFQSTEAALAYDAQFADIYRDVPNHADVTVELGNRTDGGPFVGSEKKFGQKLPLGENFLKQITIKNMATYADGNTNTWALKIWAWNTDYATTVAGTPLYVITGENHQDNQDFVVDVPAKLLISGDVYYELEYLTGSAQFTGWTAESILVEGVESYVNGELKEGTYASSVVVGVELPPVETIYYDGENGTTTVPVQGVKYFVRGASGKTLVIENAFNFVITADNLMGQTVVLQPDVMGKIEVTVPEDWFTFELIIENVCGEPAVFTMNLVEPGSAAEGDGTPESPFIMTGTEGTITAEFISGFEVVFYSYTATATGTVTFAGTDNMDVFIEDAYGSEWLGTAEATYNVVEGETYRFFIASADWSAGVAEGTWTLNA